MIKQWEDGEDSYSDILGTGCYQFIYDGAGDTKMKHKVGFIRPQVDAWSDADDYFKFVNEGKFLEVEI